MVLWLFIFVAITGVTFFGFCHYRHDNEIHTESIITSDTKQNTDSEDPVSKTPFKPNDSIANSTPDFPISFNIDVPFTSQAPLYNWDMLHEDACEEASLIMLYYWHNGKIFENSNQAEQEIQKMVEFENDNNYGPSITLQDLGRIGESYLSLNNIQIAQINNIDDIKKTISQNKPIIIGAAGKILPNPNFRNGGPNYHMLVIKGYDENGFITNDPGTRRGESFYYQNDDLFNAIHNWDPENILNGSKTILYLNSP